MSDQYKEVSLEITKKDLFDMFSISVKDRTALKVDECLKFDEAESCDTHDRDKI